MVTEEQGDVWTTKIEFGATVGAPMWDDYGAKRTKNWMAVIALDPTQPNGLSRKFIDKAHGTGFCYLVAKLNLGDPIECAAGTTPSQLRKRFYGVVTELTADRISITKYDSARKAIAVAKAFNPPVQPVNPPVDLVTVATEALVAELQRRGVQVQIPEPTKQPTRRPHKDVLGNLIASLGEQNEAASEGRVG